MAQFNKAYSILTQAEFSNRPEKFLHKNKKEKFLTIGGVYERFHPTAISWEFVHSITTLCGYNLETVIKLIKEEEELKKVIPTDEFQKSKLNSRKTEIKQRLDIQDNYLKRASVMLYNDSNTYKQVYLFFKKEFWDRIRLDEILAQNTANEIFISGVHLGTRRAVKLAQETVGALADGILGNITIKCLNNYNESAFDEEFDRTEIKFYRLNNGNSNNLQAFINRAVLV